VQQFISEWLLGITIIAIYKSLQFHKLTAIRPHTDFNTILDANLITQVFNRHANCTRLILKLWHTPALVFCAAGRHWRFLVYSIPNNWSNCGRTQVNCNSMLRKFNNIRKNVFEESVSVCVCVLRGRWCNTIVLNAYASSEEKSDDSEDSVCEE